MMTFNTFYVSDNRVELVKLNKQEMDIIENKSDKFHQWLIDLYLDQFIYDMDIVVDGKEDDDDNSIGYIMPEDWKYTLIDNLAMIPTIDEIETFIGELGIRKAFKLADESGFYEEEDYKEALTTDEGLRRMFYMILYTLIEVDKDIEEVDEDEYRIWFPED
jgi:hypothetical protein